MARKQRSDKGRKRAHKTDGTFQADNPATPENEAYMSNSLATATVDAEQPALHPVAADERDFSAGSTSGYRDSKDKEGAVERKNFPMGTLPDGWHDTPAKCGNCDGKSHPEYVDVD